VSDKLKAASNAFEAAKAVVFFVAMIAFLVILWIGYIATGGEGVRGFFRFVFG
jgi:hypothetical protein